MTNPRIGARIVRSIYTYVPTLNISGYMYTEKTCYCLHIYLTYNINYIVVRQIIRFLGSYFLHCQGQRPHTWLPTIAEINSFQEMQKWNSKICPP